MKTAINKAILFLSLVLIAFSCDDSDDKKQTINCTEEFAIIPLKVQYSDESPVTLDSYKVMWGEKDITPYKDFASEEYKAAQKAGVYTIVDDKMQPELEGETISVMVYGYINEKEVFAEKYKVTADQCHVDYKDEKSLNINIGKKCTDVFAQIQLKVQSYSNQEVVALHSYKVMWEDRDITPIKDFESEEFKVAQKTGLYPILDDSMQPELEGKTVTILVFGDFGTVIRETFDQKYLVGADECHVLFLDEKPLVADVGHSCTTEFVRMWVKVQYTDGTPVLLDNHKIMWGDRDITLQPNEDGHEAGHKSGIYTILTDRMKSELLGKDVDITFYGYINDKEVVSETYMVGADECHVMYNDDKARVITIEKP